jgi:hypothetical protein
VTVLVAADAQVRPADATDVIVSVAVPDAADDEGDTNATAPVELVLALPLPLVVAKPPVEDDQV